MYFFHRILAYEVVNFIVYVVFFTLRLTSTAQRANFIVLFAVLSLNAVAVIIRIAELCAKSGRNTRKDFYKLGLCMRTGFA